MTPTTDLRRLAGALLVGFLGLLGPACGGSPTKVDARPAGDATSGGDLVPPSDASDASGAPGGDSAADADASADTSAPDAATGSAPDLRADTASDVRPIEAGPDAPPAPVSGSPLRALAVSTGLQHTCALLDNHRIKCWGENTYGELGTGDARARGVTASEMGNALPFVDLGTGRTAIAVSAGKYHTCAILDDGSVKCWGLAILTGVPVASSVVGLGDAPGEMGDKLPALALGAGRKAKLLASGEASSCAMLDDGSASCWGDATMPLPQIVDLGTTRNVLQLAPGGVGVIALFDDGFVSSVLPQGTGGAWSPGKATFIAGSPTNRCAVLVNGSMSCSGGDGPWSKTSDLVAAWVGEYSASCGLFAGGAVRCWGVFGACEARAPGATYWCGGPREADGSFAAMLGRPAVALPPGGNYHACALLDDGSVRCWAVSDSCLYNNGTVVSCSVPQMKDPNLGASVDVVTTANGPRYGAWNAIDLGTNP